MKFMLDGAGLKSNDWHTYQEKETRLRTQTQGGGYVRMKVQLRSMKDGSPNHREGWGPSWKVGERQG